MTISRDAQDAEEALAGEIRLGIEEAGRPGGEDAPLSAWDRADRFTVPAVEPGASFARIKKLLLRVLRVVTRSQGTFNAIILEGARDLEASLARESARTREAVERLQQAIARTKQEIDIAHARFSAAESARPAPPPDEAPPARGTGLPEGFYLRFEEEFRGPEAAIRERQTSYAAFFRGAPGSVLDCGCGRGEFLRVLAEAGVPSYGVDSNRVAVELARRHAVDARAGDAFTHLRGLEGSLGGVSALQFVEHLEPPSVYEFLGLCRRALAPGGRLLLETINPDSAYALRAFRLDPTHRWPVPAGTLELMAREAGFQEREIEWLSPVPPEEALEERSENDRKLNRWLFGPQDYALRAVNPPA